MSLKILLEDDTLRQALREEARAILLGTAREDAQKIHAAELERALGAIATKVLDAFKPGRNYGPYGCEFQDKLRAELREALLPMLRGEVHTIMQSGLERLGGIEVIVKREIGAEVRRCVQEEFKKIKEAGEVLVALRGAVKE